jgi:hypothetical protein
MVIECSRSLVAGLDSGEVTDTMRRACLRQDEMQQALPIQNRRRWDEWVAGRIAAKYAFLCGERFPGTSATDALDVRRLRRSDVDTFRSEDYRAVSVAKNQTPGGGPARVGWSASSDSLPVSISHSAGVSCAWVGAHSDHNESRSLDLETPAPRVPEFYRHTFTQREREWVGASAVSHGLHSDWLYTLLWSVRESLLKLPCFQTLSLWDMPGLEIDIPGNVEQLVQAHNSKDLSGSFSFLQARTSHGPFRLAVAGAPNLILTAVTGLG